MTEPNSPLAAHFIESPNHDPRVGDDVDMLLLHYTGMSSGAAAQERLCDPEAKVSSHYIVHEDGSIVQLVDESRRARHAGVSSWHGLTDVNSVSVGIEIVNGGHDYHCPPFPDPQIDAVIRLCRDIQSRWPIPQSRVLGHSDVAPDRKRDPGERFPWDRLYREGIGLWVAPEPIGAGPELKSGDSGDAVSGLQEQLSDYGYGIPATGIFCELTSDVVMAFQRHFRPLRVDGAADVSTLATLHRLLLARDHVGRTRCRR
jgi:N-acetylmuramoyl-L-alanine amidase